jgi:hypothetical protein
VAQARAESERHILQGQEGTGWTRLPAVGTTKWMPAERTSGFGTESIAAHR